MSSSLAEGNEGSDGDVFLSPRSRVAKMLAEIDDAPTPSPPEAARANRFQTNAKQANPNLDDFEGQDDVSPSRRRLKSTDRTADVASGGDDDSDHELVRRPMGRSARRMLVAESSPAAADRTRVHYRIAPYQGEHEEELYSTTPVKSSGLKRRRELDQGLASSPVISQSSPALFVSPAKSHTAGLDSEYALSSNPITMSSKERLAQLVAQKREERLAQEATERDLRDQSPPAHRSSELPDDYFEGAEDAVASSEVDRILSDAVRPSRKASKRALLEMERETQRMARQQALAHQMKVKKKFSTTDLFAKFNFRQSSDQSPQKNDSSSSEAVGPSPARSLRRDLASTPPSSPPTPFDKQKMLVDSGALAKMVPIRQETLESLTADDEDLPDMADIIRSSQRVERPLSPSAVASNTPGLNLARWGKKAIAQTVTIEDEEDDLEILQPLPRHLQVFDRVQPAKRAENHSNAIHILRHLSHIGQNDARPNKPGAVKPSIHPQELEAQLRQRAREQAHRTELERLEELKAKGIIVQSAEERERESETLENLLEKARQEAQDLRKLEKAARKEAGEEVTMDASDDESEDGDYALSGSEDEEGGVRDHSNELVDEAADESTADEDEDDEDLVEVEEAEAVAEELEHGSKEQFLLADTTQPSGSDAMSETTTTSAPARKSRKSRVIADDDDDESVAAAEEVPEYEDPFAAFGFGGAHALPKLMSPTQAFNATMQTPTQDYSQQESFDTLGRIAPLSSMSLPPPPTLQLVEANAFTDDSQTQRPTTQSAETHDIELNWETQLPETPVPAMSRQISGLSDTPGWEPTQDPGMASPWSAVRRAQLQRESILSSALDGSHDTQPTVQLRVSESPMPSAAQRRGRLVKRKPVAADDSDNEAPQPNKKNAFREMKRRRIETLGAADRAEAEAELKRMMEDQAEESEDEYAGLGGDDTDMIAPESAEDAAMIDSAHIDVDERAIAAHYADRQRAEDEEATKKLYKDLTTGALRRRTAGGGWDLDEDEDDIAVRRRQMRQREEARKRRLLLQDDGVRDWMEKGKQTRGKDAFLRAIADDDAEADDLVDLDDQEPAAKDAGIDSQSQPAQSTDMDALQEVSGNSQRGESERDDSRARSQLKERRSQVDDAAFSRPTSLLQVRESLSFLLDEPGMADDTSIDLADAFDEGDFSDSPLETEGIMQSLSEDEDAQSTELARRNSGGFAPNPKAVDDAALMPPPRLPASQRRTLAKSVAGAVLDRLSLKRGNSSGNSSSGSSRSAWGAGTSVAKTPSLLRRATTNMTASGANERGVTIGSGARAGSERGVTVGSGSRVGGGRSSFAAQARAEERKAVLEASAARRAESTAKIAALRRAASSGMVKMGSGGWE